MKPTTPIQLSLIVRDCHLIKIDKVICLQYQPAQVESYLKEVNKSVDEGSNSNTSQQSNVHLPQEDFTFDSALPTEDAPDSQQPQPAPFAFSDFSAPQEDTFMGNGALIGLGYSETLPPFEVQEELYVDCPSLPYGHDLV